MEKVYCTIPLVLVEWSVSYLFWLLYIVRRMLYVPVVNTFCDNLGRQASEW